MLLLCTCAYFIPLATMVHQPLSVYSVCATEELLKEQWSFSFLPPKFGLVRTIHYPAIEFGNLSCLEGYIVASSGCKILENFM